MSDLIGEARVRVRPDTHGFQSDVQSQLKAPLVSIGKLITGALAIKGGFDFAKDIVSDAARVQKSTEVIRAEFGKAGDSIIEFADKGGLALGLTEHDTEATAARFGILFKNIGVGKTEAAAMTLNLEKLAGSIAAIRGKDPAEILGTLPLALSGSLRGLRQLGFAFTPVQVKEEALRLGLIKTQKQALDPGARAIAIYALVTQHLGDYQAQAAKHSDDAYNIQKRLTAEWDHAKETLGTGLLPQIAKGGQHLSEFIDKEEKSGELQRDFNIVIDDGVTVIKGLAGVVTTVKTAYDGFAKLVGGDHNAAKILSEGFLLLYTRSKLIKWGVLQAGVKGIGVEAATTKTELGLAGAEAVTWKREAGGALVAVKNDVADVGTTAVVASTKVGRLRGSLARLKGLGPIIIPIALSFVPPDKKGQEALDKAHLSFLGRLPFIGSTEQQIAEAGQRAHDAVFGKDTGLLGLGGKPKKVGGLTPGAAILKETYDEAKLLQPNLTPAMFKLEQQIARAGPGLKKTAKGVGRDISKGIGEGAAESPASIAKAGATALAALWTAAALQAKVAADELVNAKYQVEQARQTLQQAIIDSKRAVADSIQSAKQNLSSIASSIAGSASATGDNVPLTGTLARRLKELQARIKSGKADTTTVSLATELQNQIAARANQPAASGGLERRLADLADLFNKGAISGKTADLRLDRILKSAGVNAAVIQRTQGVAKADEFRAEVRAFKQQVAASEAGPQAKGKTGFEIAIVKPIETLRATELTIHQDEHAVGQAQLTVQRLTLAAQRAEHAEHKREVALLAKIEAKLPSKHDSALLEALLRKQGTPKTAADAAAAARGRHHR